MQSISEVEIEVEKPLLELCSKYKIDKVLGEGSFGIVYLARDSNQNKVALKCINLDKLINYQKNIPFKDYKRTLLESEYQTMKMCDSENLIQCFDLIESQRWRVLVLEFCQDGSLFDYIEKESKIPEEQCINILSQLMVGFTNLHKNKIIHRDIKTQNILIHKGLYKIADFGLAKKVKELTRSREGTILGSVSTMAPEVRAGNKYNFKADLWSLGVIYFEMLTKRLPFGKNVSEESVEKFKNKLERLEISEQSKDLLKKILVINPDQRLEWSELYRMWRLRKGVFKDLPIDEDEEDYSKIYIKLQKVQNNLPLVPVVPIIESNLESDEQAPIRSASALTSDIEKPDEKIVNKTNKVISNDPWMQIQHKLQKDNEILIYIDNSFTKVLSKQILKLKQTFGLHSFQKLLDNVYILLLLVNSQGLAILGRNKLFYQDKYYIKYQKQSPFYIFQQLYANTKHCQHLILSELQPLANSLSQQYIDQLQSRYLTYECKSEEHVAKVQETIEIIKNILEKEDKNPIQTNNITKSISSENYRKIILEHQ